MNGYYFFFFLKEKKKSTSMLPATCIELKVPRLREEDDEEREATAAFSTRTMQPEYKLTRSADVA